MPNWMMTAIAAAAFAGVAQAAAPDVATVPDFDTVIANGRVLDGSGNPAFPADVGIVEGRIAAVGDLSGASARQRIDASGKLVAPGFVDLHSHAFEPSGPNGAREPEDEDPARRAAPNLVAQGITTVVINQDGRSPLALDEQRQWLEAIGIGPNALLMVGHGAVRKAVMGDDVKRPARPDEIERMRSLVRDAMEDGAFGLSAGLEYSPGRWSTTDEVVALAEVIATYGGVYISHERSEGTDPMWFWPSRDEPGPPTLLDAVSETIEIGERSGATVVASHIKAKGAHYWGAGRAAIQLIESARRRGVDVYADQYPYDTSGTDGETVLLPAWAIRRDEDEEGAQIDYAARLRAALADPVAAAALRRDVAHEIRRRGSAEKILLLAHSDPALVGRTLAQIARDRGVSPVEMAILLQTEGAPNRPGGAHLRGFSMSDVDIDLFAARNWMATTSDAGIALPGDRPEFIHPRFYGAFPRKIRRYAIERGVLTLEDAIRSATSLPAQILGLDDRGTIRVGAAADVVVFDPDAIRDLATAQDIHRYPEGIEWVLVNGRPAVAAGRPTGVLAGQVIPNRRRPGSSR